MKRTLVGVGVVAVVVLAVGAVVGIAFRPDDADESTRSVQRGRADLPYSLPNSAGNDAERFTGDVSESDISIAEDKPADTNLASDKVIKSGSIELRVGKGKLDAAGDDLQDLIREYEGAYVESAINESKDSTVTIRVPVVNYEEFIAKVRDLGKVTSESQIGTGVDLQFIDLDARLRTLRAREARLLKLMEDADATTAATLQEQLFAVQEEIDRTEGQKRVLQSQVDFATISVRLYENGAPTVIEEDAPILTEYARVAGEVSLRVIGGTLVVLSVLAPLAVILVPLGFLVRWLVIRSLRRRQSATA